MRTNILLILGAIAVVWATAALLIIWWDTGCFQRFDMACNDRPWPAIKAFIVLDWGEGWLFKYQNLLAGLLTGVGAFTAFALYGRQRADQISDRAHIIREARIDLLRALGAAFRELDKELEAKNKRQAETAADSINFLRGEISKFAPGAANLLGDVLREIEPQVRHLGREISNAEAEELILKQGRVVAHWASNYFTHNARSIVTLRGDVVFNKIRFTENPPDDFPEILSHFYSWQGH